jgi:hypothetical protein
VLTDDLTSTGTNKFVVPPLSFIGAGGFVKWVADANTDEGRNHVSFSLDSDADAIRIYANNGSTIIDTVSFAAQTFGVSQGRLGDGVSNFVNFPNSPTPGESNYRLVTDLVINEILTRSIRQRTPLSCAESEKPTYHWRLVPQRQRSRVEKFRIPNGTTVPGNGFV